MKKEYFTDKYWYITDENEDQVWDAFGGSSTVIVSELPTTGDPDVDYILAVNDEYQYYKYINNQWRMIAGSSTTLIAATTPIYAIDAGTPASHDLNPSDYVADSHPRAYLDRTTLTLYVPESDGNDGYVWTSEGSLVATPSTSKDYFVYYDKFHHLNFH